MTFISICNWAGECLGELCRQCGSDVYTDNKSTIITGIRDNLEREIDGDDIIDSEGQVRLPTCAVEIILSRTNCLLFILVR